MLEVRCEGITIETFDFNLLHATFTIWTSHQNLLTNNLTVDNRLLQNSQTNQKAIRKKIHELWSFNSKFEK